MPPLVLAPTAQALSAETAVMLVTLPGVAALAQDFPFQWTIRVLPEALIPTAQALLAETAATPLTPNSPRLGVCCQTLPLQWTA